jgi:hypothetical protein
MSESLLNNPFDSGNESEKETRPIPIPKKPEHLKSNPIRSPPSLNPFEEDTTSSDSSLDSPVEFIAETTLEEEDENPFEELTKVLPPRLPPRPLTFIDSPPESPMKPSSMASLSLDKTTPLFQPPPPLPDRQTTSNLDDEKYGNLRIKKDIIETPDLSNVYRSPPLAEYLPTTELFQKGQSMCLCFSGFYCVTGLNNIRIWYIPSAENRISIPLQDAKTNLLATAFVNCFDLEYEGKYLWAALDTGELIEIDTESGKKIAKNTSHSAPITMILKSRNEMYTIDDNGGLKIWSPDQEGRISLNSRPRSLRIQSKILFASIVDQDTIWTCQLKIIEVYSLNENVPNLLLKKLEVNFGISNITCISFVPMNREVITGHECGKITVYSADSFDKIRVIQPSSYKILSILGVKDIVWVGYQTGKINIFKVDKTGLWILILDFLAYPNNGVSQLVMDDTTFTGSSINTSVMSLSENGHVRIWDGNLTKYNIDSRLKERELEYSTLSTLKVNVLTFNIDSRKPSDMDSNREDREIMKSFIDNECDIFTFGFQELVDLENKSVSAKTFLKGSKKTAQVLDSKLDQRLKLWKERLLNMFPVSYGIVEVQQLVGLFQCIIAKNTLQIKDVNVKFVKTGLGGYHGNKVTDN